MPLLAKWHSRHREVDDYVYGRARLLRAGPARSQLLLLKR